MPRPLHRLARAFAALVLVAGAATAQAQSGSSNSTVTTSVSRAPDTFVDTLRTESVTTFSTRLIGQIDGDPTLWFDQTFAAPFADTLVQDAIGDARDALAAASTDPLLFSGPTLFLAGSPVLVSSVTGAPVVLGDPVITTTLGFEEAVGPGTIAVGNRGNCTGLDAFSRPIGCTGVAALPPQSFFVADNIPYPDPADQTSTFVVTAGSTNTNINTNFQFEFTREIVTTETFSVLDTWRLLGTPQRDPGGGGGGGGQVPLPGSLALLAAGLLAAGLRTAGPSGFATRRRTASGARSPGGA